LRHDTMIAAAFSLPVVVLAMGGHVFPAFADAIPKGVNNWVQFLLTSVVLVWPGARFYRLGIPSLLRGHPDMNALVALGTAAAWGYSTLVLLAPDLLPKTARVVYFEAAAVIVTLILLGRLLEARAKGTTGSAVAKLIGLQPSSVTRVKDGQSAEIPISEIALKDHILARPGSQIAVDGVVVRGDSHVDESMISGEPIPVHKGAGDPVVSGTLNTNGVITYEATAIGRDTTLARIIALVEEAQATRLPIQSLVNRIAGVFVPAVLVIAVVSVLTWLLFGPGLSQALVAGVSVLIIACPCALGLATPTSIMVGTGRAAELGVLFRKGDALQSLNKADVIAFDKTGTLTAGCPELDSIHVTTGSENEVLRLAASLEHASEHPIARAIVAAAEARDLVLVEPAGFENRVGFGVSGQLDGADILVGSAEMMCGEGHDLTPLEEEARAAEARGNTAIYVALQGALVGMMIVADRIKPTTQATLDRLKESGLEIAMISGDSDRAARAIALDLGIDAVIANVRPAQKAEALKELQAVGKKVAFVGDGINDAPALAQADIGIALGTGTDVAIETADIVLINGDLAGVAHAHAMSRATLKNIYQNLGWAFGYNILLIPVAAGVLYPLFGLQLSPMLAAAAMALSSVFVVSNALRLRSAAGSMA